MSIQDMWEILHRYGYVRTYGKLYTYIWLCEYIWEIMHINMAMCVYIYR